MLRDRNKYRNMRGGVFHSKFMPQRVNPAARASKNKTVTSLVFYTPNRTGEPDILDM